MISGDFLTRWNAIIVGKRRKKEQFCNFEVFHTYNIFWIEVFHEEVLD